MVYRNAERPSRRRDIIPFYVRQACLHRLAAVLMAVCLSQVAIAAGGQTRLLRQATVPIVAVRFTPSGGVLAASKDGTVTMWNRDSDRPLWNISFKRPRTKNEFTQIEIEAMDLSLDGRVVAVAYIRSGQDENLRNEKAGDPGKQKAAWEPHLVLIDTADGAIKQDIQQLRNVTFRELILSPDGTSVFITTVPSWIPRNNQSPVSMTHVLSMETGREVRSFHWQDWIARAVLSPDGKLFAAAVFRVNTVETRFGELQFYDAGTGQLLRSSKYETTTTSALDFSPDGRLLALSRAAKDGIRVDLVPTDGAGQPARTFTVGQTTEIRAVAFIESHRIALAGGRLPFVGTGDVGEPFYKDKGGAVIIVDERTGKKLKSHEFKSFVTCLAISRDGSRMLAGMYDGQIAITAPQ